MSMSLDERAAATYVDAAGVTDNSGYSARLSEVAWLLEASGRWSSLRLKLLQALQAALPRGESDPEHGSPESDLKAALTDLIIMQSRLDRRSEGLAGLLDAAVDQGVVSGVPIDPADMRAWAASILTAAGHLRATDNP